MASLFKPTYPVPLPSDAPQLTHKNKPHVRVGGKLYPLTAGGTKYLKPMSKWYGKYTDGGGQVQRVPLSADLTAAELMLAELVKRAERQRRGLFDPAEDHARRPLADYLTDSVAVLEAKVNPPTTSPKPAGGSPPCSPAAGSCSRPTRTRRRRRSG